MISNLRIHGDHVRYEWETFVCEFTLRGNLSYWELHRILEDEPREVHERRMVSYTKERQEDFREDLEPPRWDDIDKQGY